MMTAPKITFIGAGSTIFVKNILGDVFHREALSTRISASIGSSSTMSVVMLSMLFFSGKRDIEGKNGAKRIIVI
ncbi:hypothetical protein MJM04_33645, partial [Salmonella enterica subsp. enterica serovar Cerro]|nr:hypothetical protein [Salmonella enterica subsp. enterica serovar Cerro]